MDYETWRSGLKPGDKVMVRNVSAFGHSAPSIYLVTKRSKVHVVCGNKKYSVKTGFLSGSDHERIEPVDRQYIKEVEAEVRQRQIVNELRHVVWGQLPSELTEAVFDLLVKAKQVEPLSD